VLQHYERDQVRDAVAALPDSARAALILREYEQLSYQEIAQVLDIPIGTVMSRLSYARQVLRKRLAKG
jgi:RNA polymerase sigma-70 factor (ECF subfamily)